MHGENSSFIAEKQFFFAFLFAFNSFSFIFVSNTRARVVRALLLDN